MAVAIRMPMPGQMTEECTVLQWFKDEGDTVVRGDPLFEIETDKSNMENRELRRGGPAARRCARGGDGAGRCHRGLDRQPGEELPEAVAVWLGRRGER